MMLAGPDLIDGDNRSIKNKTRNYRCGLLVRQSGLADEARKQYYLLMKKPTYA